MLYVLGAGNTIVRLPVLGNAVGCFGRGGSKVVEIRLRCEGTWFVDASRKRTSSNPWSFERSVKNDGV